MSLSPSLMPTPRLSPSPPHQPPFQSQQTLYPPSPPLSPDTKLETDDAKSSSRPSFSFASPFAFLPVKKSSKAKKKSDEENDGGSGVRVEEGDVGRKKRLPSGQTILIKGPYQHADYPPFPPPSPNEIPPLPPLPSMLGLTGTRFPFPKTTASSDNHAGSPSERHPELGKNLASNFLSSAPSLQGLHFNGFLPDERSLLPSTPSDFSPLSLALSLPLTEGASPLSSPEYPLTRVNSVGSGTSVGGRNVRIPPPRPLPPPPHLGLSSFHTFHPSFNAASKSNPSTPVREIDDPFASLGAALAARPVADSKGPALRAVASSNISKQEATNVRSAGHRVRVPSLVCKKTEPLKLSPRKKVTTTDDGIIGSDSASVKRGKVELEQDSPMEKEEEMEREKHLTPKQQETTEDRKCPMSAKEKRDARMRSVHGLKFPVPPSPFFSSPSTPESSKSGGAATRTSPSIPKLPQTPPLLPSLPKIPHISPIKGMNEKYNTSPTKSLTAKQRRRSTTISGSPSGATHRPAASPPSSPTKSIVSARGQSLLLWPESAQSPALTTVDGDQARLHAYAHAQAHNKAQAQAMGIGIRVLGHRRGQRSIGELEEENRLLREALKAQRHRVLLLQGQAVPADSSNAQLGSSALVAPASPSRGSPGLKPLHLASGPPPFPLPPTPASRPLLKLTISDEVVHGPPSYQHTTSSFCNAPPSADAPPHDSLRAEISTLESQLARAKGEIEAYKKLTGVPSPAVGSSGSPAGASEDARTRKWKMKRSRSEPQLSVGLGIMGIEDEEDSDVLDIC